MPFTYKRPTSKIRTYFFFFILTFIINSQAQTTLVVDPSGSGNYTSIQAAFDAINKTTVNEKITIRIKPGVYDEHLVLDSIAGTNRQFPIVIESFTGDTADVIIDHDSANTYPARAVFDIRMVNYVIIKNLSFNAPTQSGYIIGLFEGAKNLIVEGNHFRDNNANQSSPAISTHFDLLATDLDLDSIFIINNKATDIQLYSNVLSTLSPKYLELSNNEVNFNRYFTNLPIFSATTSVVKRNVFLNNAIGYFTNSRVVWIEANKCISPSEALVVNANSNSDSAAIVFNNFISYTSSIGIQIGSGRVQLYHNSIFAIDSNRQSFGLYIGNTDSAIIMNNIIAGMGPNAHGIFLSDSIYPYPFSCDYNTYYLPTGNLSYNYYGSQLYYKTLNDHINRFQLDSHSLTANPLFMSTSDLHVRNAILKGNGINIPWINKDIDGDNRDSNNVCIGADAITGEIDLKPISFNAITGNFYPGRTVQIEYEVENIGDLDLSTLSWYDNIYLSTDQTLDQNDLKLAEIQNSFSLPAGDTYIRRPSASIPYVAGGSYYLILNVNNSLNNFEETSNNILISQALTLPTPQLPNLQVTAVNVPTSVYSGKSFNVSWTVKNNGNAATTGGWTDYIFVSHDQNLLLSPWINKVDSLLKLKISAPNSLKPGESYTSSASFNTPIKSSGNIYYKVQTNAQQDIFEQDTTFADNGRLSAALNVIQSPLPDLVLVDANIQSTAFSGDTIPVNWTVSNLGQQKTYRTDRYYRASPLQNNPKMWYDIIVITKDPVYNPKSKNNITKAFYAQAANVELEPDSSYTVYKNISLDKCEYGTYYVFALTNYTYSTFELSYANNLIFVDSIEIVLKPNPDLTPTALQLNNSPASGKTIDLTYTVKNDGFSNKDETYHRDRIYLHTSSDFSNEGLRYLGQFYMYDTLLKGVTYNKNLSLNVPYNAHGSYYLTVITDADDRICEAPNEDNNIKTIGPINIDLSKTPDLVVESQLLTDTLLAGQNLDLLITTTNQGEAVVEENDYYNEIYLVGGANVHQLLKLKHNSGLLPNDSIEDVVGISLPLDLKEGSYQIMIHTDYSNRIFEYDKEANNYWYSDYFYLNRDLNQVCDLEVKSMTIAQSNLRAGDLIDIELEISNNSRATYLTGWKDQIYLELNGELLAIQEINHIGRIESNETITKTISYRIPFNISGNIDFHYRVNVNNNPLEYILSNNLHFVSKFVSTYIPPDLEASNISVGACCTLYALQNDSITVEVTNNGPGIVAGQSYFAKLYLSNDPYLDKYDYLLGTHQQFSGLNVNSTEQWTLPVKYPSHLSGDLFVLVQIDSDNDIYESVGEDNNLYSSAYTVSLSNEITDLSIDSIYITNYSGLSDAFFTVNYRFSKPENDSLERDWTNKIVLSKSKNYVLDGINSSTELYNANLAAGETDFQHSTLAILQKNLMPGWYYIGIMLDSYNEVYETTESNNVRFSEDSFYFDFSIPLQLNLTKDSVFYEGMFASDVYYNIERATDYGMIVDLDVSDNNASTEMFHAAGRVPTSLDYDNRYNNPYLADQQIIVPVTDTAVKDYVHLIPSYIPPVYHGWDPNNNQIDPVPYSITATAAEFSIYEIFPQNGSVYGNTTVEVTGFDFDTTTLFFLTKGQDTIFPISTAILNSSNAILYLDLRDREIGYWSVVAQKTTKVSSLNQGFEILNEGFEHPWVNINIVPAELTRRSTSLNLNFGNYANTDGFDYWLVLAMTTASGDISNLNTYYQGSSEEELNERYGFDGNPTGDSTFVDDDNIRYFVYWLPKLAAKSQTTFTYIINQAKVDTTQFYALLFRQPMSDYTLSGNANDLAQSATMFELYEAFSNNAGLLNKSDFDCDNINIAKVQRELSTQTILLADHVHGGVSTFSGASSMKQMSNKAYEAWKKDALLPFQSDSRSEEIKQKMFKEAVLEKKGITDIVKGYIDNINPFTNVTGRFYKEDPPFSDLVKNVFSCLDNNPNFKQDKSGPCLTCSYNTEHTHQTCHWTCDKKKNNEGNAITRWVNSFDPNDIVGPEGITELRYVLQESEMGYQIRFENKPDAGAPAVEVSIQNPLDTAFKLQSFKLTEIGFGDTIIFLNEVNNINKVIELGPKYQFQKLRIVAGLDAINHRAFWRLTSIDPITGNPIQDPFGGFLPPNDSTGIGEGYVKYSITLREMLSPGLEVNNKADIKFDQNEIIPTNTWTNIVVDAQPTSQVLELPSISDPDFELRWSGSDGELGPGISSYSIFVSINDSSYFEWIKNSTDTFAIFHGKEGQLYKFFSIIHLSDGTTELAPKTHDAETRIKTSGIEILHHREMIKLYPNPGNAELHIKRDANTAIKVEIISMTGTIIHTYSGTEEELTISTNDLAAGMYIIRINTAAGSSHLRWIKQ